MNRLRDRVDRATGALLAALMAAAAANVLWQVLSRYVLGAPSSFTGELARYLLVWIGLAGAAHAAGRRRHLAVELLPGWLAPRGRARLAAGVEGCVALFALAAMVGGGSGLVALTLSLGQRSAALGLPLAVVYAAVPAAGAVIAVHAGLAARDALRAARGPGAGG